MKVPGTSSGANLVVYSGWVNVEAPMPTKTKLFKSNQTQAVRLPKDVAFPDDVKEVEIIKVGNSRVISPVGHRWDAFFPRHQNQ